MSKLSFWFYLHCHAYYTSIKDLSQTSCPLYLSKDRCVCFWGEKERNVWQHDDVRIDSQPEVSFRRMQASVKDREYTSLVDIWIHWDSVNIFFRRLLRHSSVRHVVQRRSGHEAFDQSHCLRPHELPGVTTQLYLSCNHPPCLFVYFIGVFFSLKTRDEKTATSREDEMVSTGWLMKAFSSRQTSERSLVSGVCASHPPSGWGVGTNKFDKKKECNIHGVWAS